MQTCAAQGPKVPWVLDGCIAFSPYSKKGRPGCASFVPASFLWTNCPRKNLSETEGTSNKYTLHIFAFLFLRTHMHPCYQQHTPFVFVQFLPQQQPQQPSGSVWIQLFEIPNSSLPGAQATGKNKIALKCFVISKCVDSPHSDPNLQSQVHRQEEKAKIQVLALLIKCVCVSSHTHTHTHTQTHTHTHTHTHAHTHWPSQRICNLPFQTSCHVLSLLESTKTIYL